MQEHYSNFERKMLIIPGDLGVGFHCDKTYDLNWIRISKY